MRKAILPILTVGLVLMLAGAGSLAYFSDSEETSGRFEAGTLVLEYNFYGWSNWEGHEIDDPFELEDVKPGDSGCFTYELKLSGNPAYICAEIELVESDDNIRDSMEFKIEWSGQETDWFTWDDDNQVMCKQFGEMQPGEDNVEICWRIPTDVGNEIQGQSLDLEIRFKAEQVRHREDMIFGIAHAPAENSALYKIYPTLGETELIVEDLPDPEYRNALAYDLNWNRLYFSRGDYWGTDNPELRYYDFATGEIEEVMDEDDEVHNLVGPVYAAAILDGDYMYIPEETNNLRKVTFDTDGDVEGDTILVEDVIDPPTDEVLAMGDIEFYTCDDTWLIGSTTEFYFIYNLDNDEYEELTAERQYQLAFGPDGTLWANHHTETAFYMVEDPLDLTNDDFEEKIDYNDPDYNAGVGGEGYYDLAGWWPCQKE